MTTTALELLGCALPRGKGFSVSTEVNRADADANLRWIREARRQADWVIFSFHSHEFGAGRPSEREDRRRRWRSRPGSSPNLPVRRSMRAPTWWRGTGLI